MNELKTLIDIGISEHEANAVLQSMSGLSSDERMEIINHAKQEKEGKESASELYVELRRNGCNPKEAAAILDMAVASGAFSISELALRELTSGYDYETQSRQERIVFNHQMQTNGWQPIYDTLGIVYRWRHSETGRLINDTVAFDGWLPNYCLPESEKPLRGN